MVPHFSRHQIAAQKEIESVRKNSGSDGRYERKTSRKGQPNFVLKAANGEIIGKSEMYTGNSGMETVSPQ